MSSQFDRPVAMALDVLVSRHVAAGVPVGLGAVTALREQVEGTIENAMAGVVVVGPMPDGWSAEEALEQVALSAAMDMLLSEPRRG